mmetsp:Transcript_10356/g.20405  ORF Transcript_10356/g.20405 Transcript_10356/m.20405 type:complete len:95 (-) Transcript_10356:245-529(-)
MTIIAVLEMAEAHYAHWLLDKQLRRCCRHSNSNAASLSLTSKTGLGLLPLPHPHNEVGLLHAYAYAYAYDAKSDGYCDTNDCSKQQEHDKIRHR